MSGFHLVLGTRPRGPRHKVISNGGVVQGMFYDKALAERFLDLLNGPRETPAPVRCDAIPAHDWHDVPGSAFLSVTAPVMKHVRQHCVVCDKVRTDIRPLEQAP